MPPTGAAGVGSFRPTPGGLALMIWISAASALPHSAAPISIEASARRMQRSSFRMAGLQRVCMRVAVQRGLCRAFAGHAVGADAAVAIALGHREAQAARIEAASGGAVAG